MLMPLAMPAMFPTIDMRPVYDGCREGFLMRLGFRTGFWPSVFLSCFAVFAISISGSQRAEGQAAAQPAPETHAAHAAAPGPLKITYSGKTEEWTTATLTALPHATITV